MEDIEDIMRMDKEKLAAPIKTIEVNPLTIHHTLFNMFNSLSYRWADFSRTPIHCRKETTAPVTLILQLTLQLIPF